MKASKSRKAGKSRKLSPWNKFVMKVFADMKKEKKDVKFRDALVRAAKLKKEGKMN
jgi:hypothetical protein